MTTTRDGCPRHEPCFGSAGPADPPGRSAVSFRISAAAMVVLAVTAPSPAAAQQSARAAALNAQKATVYVAVERKYQGNDLSGIGTGFFIHPDGYVLTSLQVVGEQIETVWQGRNRKVTSPVQKVSIILGAGTGVERLLAAQIVARDAERALALLKVGSRSPYWVAPSPEGEIRVGETVYVIGHPAGDLPVVDGGGRLRPGDYPAATLVKALVTQHLLDAGGKVVGNRTDAVFDPGNAGGPLLDEDGRLAGVLSAEATEGTPVACAVAPDRVWSFYLEQLIDIDIDPGYVPTTGGPVTVTVEPAVLPFPAVRCSLKLEGPGLDPLQTEFTVRSGQGSGAVEVPTYLETMLKGSGYTATVDFFGTKAELLLSQSFGLAAQRPPRSAAAAHGSAGGDPRVGRPAERGSAVGDRGAQPAGEDGDHAVSDELQDPTAVLGRPTPVPSHRLHADLFESGVKMFRQGRYTEAAATMERVLVLDPSHEMAAAYLKAARERRQLELGESGTGEATDGVEGGIAEQPPVVVEKIDTAAITLLFDSPLQNGAVNLWFDGEPLAPVAFSFKKSKLQVGVGGRGRVEQTFEVSAGEHEIEVSLETEDRGELGRAEFTRSFAARTRWTLKINLPSSEAKPEFYIVQRRD